MSKCNENILRLGTRGSLLARMQSLIVADELEKYHPGLSAEVMICSTIGDQVQDRSLAEIGGKGLFTKELEQALLGGEIDFAVHSFKDVPVTMPLIDTADLVIAAVPHRLDPHDVLVSRTAQRIADLPGGARVGTGSLRRRCQLLQKRPDLQVEPIRGNIDTRLRKVWDGELDAVILAAAGLRRSGLFLGDSMTLIDLQEMLPAAGQGALALQCRRDNLRARTLLGVLNDSDTACCVAMERSIVAALEGDCHSPIAAYASFDKEQITLRTAIGSRDGLPPIVYSEQNGPSRDAERIAGTVIDSLVALGARDLLHNGPKATSNQREIRHVSAA